MVERLDGFDSLLQMRQAVAEADCLEVPSEWRPSPKNVRPARAADRTQQAWSRAPRSQCVATIGAGLAPARAHAGARTDVAQRPPPTNSVVRKVGGGTHDGRTVCWQFKEAGSCSRGESCRFLHVVPDAAPAAVPKYVPDSMPQAAPAAAAVPNAMLRAFSDVMGGAATPYRNTGALPDGSMLRSSTACSSTSLQFQPSPVRPSSAIARSGAVDQRNCSRFTADASRDESSTCCVSSRLVSNCDMASLSIASGMPPRGTHLGRPLPGSAEHPLNAFIGQGGTTDKKVGSPRVLSLPLASPTTGPAPLAQRLAHRARTRQQHGLQYCAVSIEEPTPPSRTPVSQTTGHVGQAALAQRLARRPLARAQPEAEEGCMVSVAGMRSCRPTPQVPWPKARRPRVETTDAQRAKDVIASQASQRTRVLRLKASLRELQEEMRKLQVVFEEETQHIEESAGLILTCARQVSDLRERFSRPGSGAQTPSTIFGASISPSPSVVGRPPRAGHSLTGSGLPSPSMVGAAPRPHMISSALLQAFPAALQNRLESSH